MILCISRIPHFGDIDGDSVGFDCESWYGRNSEGMPVRKSGSAHFVVWLTESTCSRVGKTHKLAPCNSTWELLVQLHRKRVQNICTIILLRDD